MPIYPNMPIDAPTPGGSSGTWAQKINAALQALDQHRHEGVGAGGAKITPTSIDINADLSFATLWSATDLKSIAFAAGSSVTGSRKIYFGADGNLYANSNGGTPIQITDGLTLALQYAGAIGGDYAADGAALNYDHSRRAFHLFQGTGGTTWARISAGELRIHEHGTTSTVHIALKAPAGLATTSELTLPSAVPAGKRLVQITPSGVNGTLTYENTGVEAITMATNASVTVSGTGDYKHGDKTLTLPAVAYAWPTVTTATINVAPISVSAAAAADFFMPIPLRAGSRIKSVTISHFGNGAADITNYTVTLTSALGATTSLGLATVTNPAAAWATTTLDLTDTTLAEGESLTLVVGLNATGISLGNVTVTYDRP